MADIISIHPNVDVVAALRTMADQIEAAGEDVCLTIILDGGDVIRLGEVNDVASANRAIVALNLALHKQMARTLQEIECG